MKLKEYLFSISHNDNKHEKCSIKKGTILIDADIAENYYLICKFCRGYVQLKSIEELDKRLEKITKAMEVE